MRPCAEAVDTRAASDYGAVPDMIPRRAYLLSTLLPVIAIVASVHAGCSDQGEGDRCNTLNTDTSNPDCAGGLVCWDCSRVQCPTASTSAAGPGVDAGEAGVGSAPSAKTGSGEGRCCPQDRTQATTDVCRIPFSGGIDSGPPVDTGVPDAPVPDAPADAPADAPVSDGATDAPADGAADAGADAPADAPAG